MQATGKSDREKTTLPTLVMPILLGLAAFVALFAMIKNGTISDDLVVRYIAGHPVSKVTTALFLIGLASLAIIAKNLVLQFWTSKRITLGSAKSLDNSEDGDDDPANEMSDEQKVDRLIGRLYAIDRKHRTHYLWQRLFNALEFIRRNRSADGLDDELKYSAESDQEEKHNRYSFVRIMIWAIPMLGFLGTVLGISEALGGITIGEDNDFQGMMNGLRSSLYVAFDTTAVALTFSIILMFVNFAIEQSEGNLLKSVDAKALAELSEHWQVTAEQQDEYVRTVKKMCTEVQKSTDELVNQQVKIWRTSIESAQNAWVEGVKGAQTVVQSELSDALGKSTAELENNLGTVIRQSDEAISRRWEQWQIALSENARLLVAHQENLLENSKNMGRALDRLNQLADMKEMLTSYIQALPDSKDYADVSQQLATAIRLLEYRLSTLQNEPNLKVAEDTDRAA